MSETKWTPGPWRVEEDTTLVWGACTFHDDGSVRRHGVPVAEANGSPRWARNPDDRISEEQRDANAALIAAAPALYAALAKIEFDWDGEPEDMAEARAALAAARGES